MKQLCKTVSTDQFGVLPEILCLRCHSRAAAALAHDPAQRSGSLQVEEDLREPAALCPAAAHTPGRPQSCWALPPVSYINMFATCSVCLFPRCCMFRDGQNQNIHKELRCGIGTLQICLNEKII